MKLEEEEEEGVVDSVVAEAVASGQELREYSASVGAELRRVKAGAVREHIAQAREMASLHSEIAACDGVLGRMETMLATFQADLGSISSEIASLQEQSVEMNLRLKNRQALRGQLSQFVDDLVVPESMIAALCEAPVTERAFLESLHELEHKTAFLREQEARDAIAAADVHSVLADLQSKAVTKLREWLLAKIYGFRKPLSNYQVPQNALLKFRFYYEFLANHQAEVAREIREEYINTVSKTLFSYFKTYHNRLQRLALEEVPAKEDVLGADDTNKASSSVLALMGAGKPAKSRAAVFSIGSRAATVRADLEAPIIVPHAAQEAAHRFHQEALLRSLGLSLAEHACHEHHFLHDFFLADGDRGRELFHRLLGRSIGVFSKAVEDVSTGSWDALGLYLSLQLLYRLQALMGRRGVAVLEPVWERLLAALWPRFEVVMNAHSESLRSADLSRLAPSPDTRPHYVTRRYAELLSGLLSVSGLGEQSGGFGLERLQPILARLESEMETFVSGLASRVPQGSRKAQLVCQINNWDLVGSVLSERGVAESREGAVVGETLSGLKDSFVEELLFPHFGALIKFVHQTEPLVADNSTAHLTRYTEKVPNLVRSFGETWKSGIEDINAEVLASFTNFHCGTGVLQAALTALLQYYHRFHAVLNHPAFAACPHRAQLVNIHHIMVELKKYKSAY